MANRKNKTAVINIQCEGILVQVPATNIVGKNMDEIMEQMKKIILESLEGATLIIK